METIRKAELVEALTQRKHVLVGRTRRSVVYAMPTYIWEEEAPLMRTAKETAVDKIEFSDGARLDLGEPNTEYSFKRNDNLYEVGIHRGEYGKSEYLYYATK